MKKLLYKGIEFDDFQLYREAENSSGCEYGYPTDEDLSTEGWEEADVYICPHCIKKYSLYSETDTCVETVEQYISGEFDDGMHSMTCGVKGCNNGNSFDCCINIKGCQFLDNGKVYAVKITETLEKVVYIEAESQMEAETIAEENWNKGDYILDADCFTIATFKATESEE